MPSVNYERLRRKENSKGSFFLFFVVVDTTLAELPSSFKAPIISIPSTSSRSLSSLALSLFTHFVLPPGDALRRPRSASASCNCAGRYRSRTTFRKQRTGQQRQHNTTTTHGDMSRPWRRTLDVRTYRGIGTRAGYQ